MLEPQMLGLAYVCTKRNWVLINGNKTNVKQIKEKLKVRKVSKESLTSPVGRSIAHFSGKVYPDQTLTLGYRKRAKKGKSEKEYDRDYEEQYDSYSERYKEYGRTGYRDVRFFDQGVIPDRFIEGAKSSQKRGKYGSKGITNYGKRNVRCIAILLQQKYGRKRLGFATTTLPPLTERGVSIALEKWGYIARFFFQKIRRALESRGKEFLYVSCTEIQAKRFASSKLPFPHLHFAYVSRDRIRGDWYITSSELRKFWREVCVQVIGEENFEEAPSERTFNASCDCQSVRKTVAGYLGKYLSKGDSVVSEMIEEGYNVFPRQWWSASMQCKKAFKKSIVNLNPQLASDIMYKLGDYLADGVITWFRFVEVEIKGKMVTIGLVAKVSKEAYANICNQVDYWDSPHEEKGGA